MSLLFDISVQLRIGVGLIITSQQNLLQPHHYIDFQVEQQFFVHVAFTMHLPTGNLITRSSERNKRSVEHITVPATSSYIKQESYKCNENI